MNTAVDIFRVKRRAGLRKSAGGLDYTRCVEYPAVLHGLDLERAQRVLEIGASKLFLGCYIAVTYPVEVHVTDLDPVVNVQKTWIERLGRRELLDAGRFTVGVEDATKLSYADASFDRVVSVSTVEHVRVVRDAAAEIGRVLEPGGLAAITVPFSSRRREVWVDRDVYGRRYEGAPQFYEHHFDRSMLEEELIGPSGLRVRSLRFLGEPGFKMTRVVYHPVAGRVLAVARWVWPWLAHRWYREIPEGEVTETAENIAVLVLEKPESGR